MALTTRQQRLIFAGYFLLSTIATVSKFQSLKDTSANYYVLGVRFSQGDAVLILANMCIATTLLIGTMLQQLLFGELRLIELEHLYERSWSTLFSLLMSVTAFKRHENTMFLVMLFCGLVCSKILHCVLCDRLDVLIQQYYQRNEGKIWNILINRVVFTLIIFGLIDVSLIKSSIDESFIHRSNMLLHLSFEMFILFSDLINAGLKFLLNVYEIHYTQKNSDEEIWPAKVWVESIAESIMSLVKSIMIPTFFVFSLMLGGWHLTLVTESFRSFHTFGKSFMKVCRLVKSARELNAILKDPTSEQIEEAEICIICRDDLVQGGAGSSRSVPKMLPCAHILHEGCIKSWLQMSNLCPTCRKEVLIGVDQVDARGGAGNQGGALWVIRDSFNFIFGGLRSVIVGIVGIFRGVRVEVAPEARLDAIEARQDTDIIAELLDNAEEQRDGEEVAGSNIERNIEDAGISNVTLGTSLPIEEDARRRYFTISEPQPLPTFTEDNSPREELVDEFCDIFKKVDGLKKDLFDGEKIDFKFEHDYMSAKSYVEQYKLGAIDEPTQNSTLENATVIPANAVVVNEDQDDGDGNGDGDINASNVPFMIHLPTGSCIPEGWQILPAKRTHEDSRDEYYIETGVKRRLRLRRARGGKEEKRV